MHIAQRATRALVFAALGAALTVGGLGGCKERSRPEVFTSALAADPETFDPARMSGAPEGRVAFNLFEGLMMPGPTTEGLRTPRSSSDRVLPSRMRSAKTARPTHSRSVRTQSGRTVTHSLRKISSSRGSES